MGTKVDLGEDLLEQAKAKENASEFSEADALTRAEIMMGERLLDDAKKLLYKVLRHNPTSTAAKEKLNEIQKQEIRELLASEGERKKIAPQQSVDSLTNSRAALEDLEKSLRISLAGAEPRVVPDLFPTQSEYEVYIKRVVKEAVALPVRGRVDVGVAHLEMGLCDAAAAVFETVARYQDQKLEGTYLLCLALIYGGKAIEATIRLEPLVRDLTLPEDQKTDFLYLMALAFEKLSDLRKAREFYKRTLKLNPRYRDVAEKLREIK